MQKSEFVMIISIVVLMVTGCFFHFAGSFYNLVRCVHSTAALVLIVAMIIHVINKTKTSKRNINA